MKTFLTLLVGFAVNMSFLINPAAAQNKEFWLGFMDFYGTTLPTFNIHITSNVATTGTVSIPNTIFSQPFAVSPNAVTTVTVPHTFGFVTTTEVPEKKGVKVVANDPINVFASEQGPAATDASVVLSVENLSTEYRLTTYHETGGPQFMIIATQDNTAIQIVPSAETESGRPAQIPFSINLQAGEAYLIQAASVTEDFTGTRVRSLDPCKPIAIFSGNVCAYVPPTSCCCNLLYEQMYPVKTWATVHYTVPLIIDTVGALGDRYRVLAAQDGTEFTINSGPVHKLNKGDFYETLLHEASVIRANRPVSVAQYAQSGGIADPFMLMLLPKEQVLKKLIFSTIVGSSTNTNHYVNIVVKTADAPSVKLDGLPILTSAFKPFPDDPDYSFAMVDLPSGTATSHVLTTDGNGLQAYVYGMGFDETYGYAASGSVNDIPFQIDFLYTQPACVGDAVSFSPVLGYTPSSYSWDFGDGATSGDPEPVHTYAAAGTYAVRMIVKEIFATSCTGSTVISDTVFKQVQIVDNSNILARAGTDTSICKGGQVQLGTTGLPGFTYSWTPVSGLSDPAIGNPVATPSQTTDYILSVTDNQSKCVKSDTVHVDVFTLPRAVYSYSKDSFTVQFTGDTSNGVYQWFWDFGDRSVTSTDQSPGHTYEQNETFTVTLIVWNQCGTDTITFDITIDGSNGQGGNTGVYNPKADPQLQIFPNPFNEKLHINYHLSAALKVYIDIVDVLGRIIYTYIPEGEQPAGDHYVEIDAADFGSPGVYYLRFNAGSSLTLKRIVKWEDK